MGARADCKKVGLYGITEISTIVGLSRTTLHTYYRKNTELFFATMIGSLILKECKTNNIDEIAKKLDVFKSIIKATEGGVKK